MSCNLRFSHHRIHTFVGWKRNSEMCIALLCYSLVPLRRHGSDRQDTTVHLIDPLHITECGLSFRWINMQSKRGLSNWLLMFHWRVLILLWRHAVWIMLCRLNNFGVGLKIGLCQTRRPSRGWLGLGACIWIGPWCQRHKMCRHLMDLVLDLKSTLITRHWKSALTLGYDVKTFEFPSQKQERKGGSLALLQIWHLILGYLLGLIDLGKCIDI